MSTDLNILQSLTRSEFQISVVSLIIFILLFLGYPTVAVAFLGFFSFCGFFFLRRLIIFLNNFHNFFINEIKIYINIINHNTSISKNMHTTFTYEVPTVNVLKSKSTHCSAMCNAVRTTRRHMPYGTPFTFTGSEGFGKYFNDYF